MIENNTKDFSKKGKKKILVVDDTLDTRTLLSSILKNAGYGVYLAKDGIEAYSKFFKLKPDIALVDILLPKMRGDVFIKWIKGTALGKETPVIVISSHTAMKEYLFQLGIELFFEKPFKTAHVLEATKEILEIYEEKKAVQSRLVQLKKRFEKEKVAKETRFKVCDICNNSMPATAFRCESCGSVRIHLVENQV